MKIRRLCAIDGIERLYDAPYFHEVALKVDRAVAPLLAAIAEKNILGGFDLSDSAGTDALRRYWLRLPRKISLAGSTLATVRAPMRCLFV
jgi:hypothetical protein